MIRVPGSNKAPPHRQSLKRSGPETRRRKSSSAAEVAPLQLWRLQRVVVYIEAHLADHVTLLDLSTVAGFSPMHFASQFRRATGVRPHDYVLRRKVEEAQVLLLTSTTPIVDIALSFGFLSQAHFTTVFKRFVGSPPLRWQHTRMRQIQSAVFRLRKLKRKQLA
jgi:AraC-like DNA-binding protein